MAELQSHTEKSEQLAKELEETKTTVSTQNDQLDSLKKQLEGLQPKSGRRGDGWRSGRREVDGKGCRRGSSWAPRWLAGHL